MGSNKTRTFFITGQFVQTLILNYDDTVRGENNKLLLSTALGTDACSDHQTLVSLKVDTEYYDSRIKPGILAVWDINGHACFIKPVIGWEPTYNWRFEIGSLLFWANSYTCGPFGMVKDNDQVYGTITWKF